jgi:hypothetical protein
MSPSTSTCIINPDAITNGMEMNVEVLQAYTYIREWRFIGRYVCDLDCSLFIPLL